MIDDEDEHNVLTVALKPFGPYKLNCLTSFPTIHCIFQIN